MYCTRNTDKEEFATCTLYLLVHSPMQPICLNVGDAMRIVSIDGIVAILVGGASDGAAVDIAKCIVLRGMLYPGYTGLGVMPID